VAYVQAKNVCTVMFDIFNDKTKNMHEGYVKPVIKNISLV